VNLNLFIRLLKRYRILAIYVASIAYVCLVVFYLSREIIRRWDNGTLTVGKEGESDPFLSYADPEPFGIGYFGVCTGWGATGDWLIEGRC